MSSPVPDPLQRLGAAGVVPVVVVDDAAQGLLVAGALSDGGLPVAEVTLRTPGALDAIAAMRKEKPDMLVGAGTVLNTGQVDAAVAAGAQFVVSPGLSAAVVARCGDAGIPVIPGVATPSDIMAALDLGLRTVKLFPAGVVGGPAAIKALAAPFRQVRFMPTGGVGPANLPDYLDIDAVHAVGGSWMVAASLVANGDKDQIIALTQAAVAVVKEVRS